MEATQELEVDQVESTPDTPQEHAAEQQPSETLPRHVRDHYDAIREKEREVRALEGEYNDLKDESAAAKKAFENADKALRNLISRGPDPQKPLEFSDAATEPVGIDAWRTASLEALGLPDAIAAKLADEADVQTVGDLEDLRVRIADRKAEWPKGIGPAKVTTIEDSIIAWLSEHRDSWGQPADEDGSNTDLAAEVAQDFDNVGILAK